MIELNATVALMNSDDYKERFIAEYLQVAIRLSKLQKMLEKWDRGELGFTPTCNKVTYVEQIRSMKGYLNILEDRAEIEKVDLSPYKTDEDTFLSGVQRIKLLRKEGDQMIQVIRKLPASRENSIAITKFQEGVMWLGMELKRRHEADPYPSSKDPSTGDKIESTADNLKM